NLSAASTETSAASPDHTQPGTPMSLTATAGDGQVTITWRRSTDSDFARYRIYRSTSANATTQIDSSSSVSDTSRTYTGLTKGTTYFFRLAAVDNANNQSTYSNEASATVFAIAPTITTGVLQNPALSKYFAIAVVSLSDLASIPSVKLWITGTPDTLTITMSALSGSSHVYTGAGEFSSSGTYNIRTRAASSSGADTVQTNTYTVALAKPGLLTTLVASNNNASLQVNKRSVKEETYFLSNLTHIGTEIIYHFGPSTTEFVEALDIEIGFESGVYPDEGKLFIYHKDGQEWKALRSQVYADRSTVKARVTQLGEFKIVYDATFAGTNLVPTSYALGQNYPNPFNPSTTIRYELPEDGFLTMRIYNLLGQEVKTLVRGVQTAGVQTVVWDGRNANGQIVATGIYLYRIETKRFTQTKKMMFIK
ncbi:T9SS type A sorting domain-containing protein, partial [Candidatus Saccharibacteria bacterium]|nr:T9SS type A sorting domain-containing protein [Candidatus Saccharibacteria bacterium]